jgi:peptidoglycan/LPS O-acetylase OafA/YrhL
LLLLPASLAWRAVAAVQGVSQWSALLLPASIDALAAGALLALAHRPSHRWLHWLAPAGWLASLALGVAWAAGHQLDFWAPTLQIPILVGLVHGAHTGLGGMARHILQARPVTYLGRISYGIYLSHLPLHFLITPHLGVLIPSKGWLMFPVLTAASIMVASLSWHALERPFHRLKSRFPFPEQPVPAPPQPLATAERVH